MLTNLKEIKKRPWYKSYPEEIRQQLESYTLPRVPLFRFLESSAKYYPNSVAMVYEPENLVITYSDLYNMCEKFASGLQNKFGVKKGDRISICSRNYPEFLIAHYGILMAGAIYVACNPILIKDELEYQFKDSKSRIVIISDDMVPALKDIINEKKTEVEKVIVFERDKELKPALFGRSEGRFTPPFFKYVDVFSDDPIAKPEIAPKKDLCAIIYTSGTTGYPKGVMISHYNAVSSAIQYHCAYTGKFPEIDESGFLKCTNHPKDLSKKWEFPIRYGIDSGLAITPWTHMMGFLAHLNAPVMAAMTIFPMPVFQQDLFLDMIRRWRIAFAGGAPQMMSTLLARPDIEQQDISSIRAWTSGGAPCPMVVGEKFEEKIDGVITEGYSLTEATCSSTKNFCSRSAVRKWGSVGVPLPFTDIKILDLKTGTTEMPIGQDGELVHNGPQVTLGYLGKTEDTMEAFKDGWLYTGDIARMDEDGFLYITGRKKELIIYKGYNIAPRMLEEILYKHADILECAVVGKKDDVAGEIPVAFVSLKEGAKVTADDIMKFVNEKVAAYKKVRDVKFVDKIPVNANGKVMRRKLETML
ncbi:MAG: acyl--CoA ligase [Deltaproteobacteria bacterium]|nr:acyl--CoA ligase [Deltaproteobacteria bacterium]